MGDHARLRQVLLNLLNNAVKFTEAGSIAVTCARSRRPTAANGFVSPSPTPASASPPRSNIACSRSSRRSTAPISRRHGGTGLGLAICKRLVELMDGEIGVVSEVGKGSTMWFTAHLPSAAKPEPCRRQSNSEFAPEESDPE